MAFPDNKNYTLPSGEVYFGRFAEGTRVVEAGGDKYLGNTPSLTLTADTDTLDHFDADAATRYKDDSVTLELNRTGTLECDHINPELLAWMFGGIATVTSQAIMTDVEETISAAKKGVRYQVGRTLANPAGVQGLSALTAETDAATPVPLVLHVDYRVDLETGGIVFLPASTVVVDAGTTNVVLTYSAAASEYHTVISGANAMVEGRLVYIARQNKGAKFNYTMPYVTLRPDGDFNLKSSDEWQVASFALEVLKLDDQTAQVYINGRPGAFV